MVTTVTESFFSKHLFHLQRKDCKWLVLKAANGLDIPYTGYIELDVRVLGQCIPGRGILIVRDPSDATVHNRKAATPGILGMNVLGDCYQGLFEQHGPQLFHSPPVKSAAPATLRALRHCEKIKAILPLLGALSGTFQRATTECKRPEVVALPGHTPQDLRLLQEADSVIGPVCRYHRRGRRPRAEERESLSSSSKALLRQWDRLVEEEGVLYRLIYVQRGGPEILQLLIPQCLKKDVLRSVHDQEGHQGTERTLQLLRARCFWPNMAQDVERWCQQCQRCLLGKAIQPKDRTYWGTGEPMQGDGTLDDWAQEHQRSLRMTQEHVRQRGGKLAQRRNPNHNDKVNDSGLEEGQPVYLRDHPPGRNKIQDHWNPAFFQVQQSPSGAGAVYIPMDGEGPARQVHRAELRADPAVLQPAVETGTPPTRRAESATPPAAEGCADEDVAIFYPEEFQDAQMSRRSLPPEEEGIPEEVTPPLRRTGRATAGQHANPHRLPRSVSIRNEEEALANG